ncbi:23S rRNA (pseudouridine(1915)-N(3))-methyltransferase RlmH [Pectinatus cerevisiiphilus]|uniref:Ribosomal RNA large subunit methyltransferase H n=1 Tax=Pectinatus cerevisiiphilus TaxID=86956 RepID=A0A4R3KB22_9FIRM|nr:23S rRNA (pseudouridine(1915)-N(3))-methyltransferase RlmH [Pectinatus cerevisiiphilus]TCS80129.1 23S rRNA (pseudouridine1915-N3)-methyltransferase [Pectinatus cerevisiiphilus]
MKITIVSAGKLKENYLREGITEFVKRLRPFAQLNIVEISEEKMPDSPSAREKEKILTIEGSRLLKQVPVDSFLFVLDVYGKQLSSEDLAEKIRVLALSGKSNLAFVIGGTFGLSADLRKKADLLISFSRMTFTHQMVKLLLVEQIYRAFKINRGEPYHW